MRSKILAGMTGGPDELNDDLYARADLPPPPPPPPPSLFGRRRVSLSRPEEAAGPDLLFFQPPAENGEAPREVVAFCHHHHHHQERQHRFEHSETSTVPQPTRLAVLVAIRFQIPTGCEPLLHLEFQAVFARASDVKRSIAGPVCASEERRESGQEKDDQYTTSSLTRREWTGVYR